MHSLLLLSEVQEEAIGGGTRGPLVGFSNIYILSSGSGNANNDGNVNVSGNGGLLGFNLQALNSFGSSGPRPRPRR